MARKSSGIFFTVKEAAEFLGVSTVTMYRYIKDGGVEAVRIGPSWRIPVKPLMKLTGLDNDNAEK